MGCVSSSRSSVRSASPSNPIQSNPTNQQNGITSLPSEAVTTPETPQPSVEDGSPFDTSPRAAHNPGIAFEVVFGDSTKPPPKRLSRLEPINGPRLTAEELDEKQRLAERKRNNEIEGRAKTASQTRRLSKRKRELMIAQELEHQHNLAQELKTKLLSAEKQREAHQQSVIDRQKANDERLRRVQQRRARLQDEEDGLEGLNDVEKDENFNNDDVDSWLEGSNNETADTGFSSATSERIYSGRESPKKRIIVANTSRSDFLNSASTVDSCDYQTYRSNRSLLLHNHHNPPKSAEEDPFFDS